MDKYEYFKGEDLNYKPSTVEQAKFGYSPLTKLFNKRLEEDNKEGLLKKLKKYWREEWKAVKSNWRSRKETSRCNKKQ